MRFSFTPRGGLLSTTLLAGAAAIAIASPASAQETCSINETNGNLVCDDPTADDVDIFPGRVDYGGFADGAYDNLDSKIAQTAPTDEEVTASQAVIDAETAEADDLAAAQTAVQESFTEDDLAAFDAVATTSADLDAALAAEADAFDAQAAAQTDFDLATQTVADAQDLLATAQAAFDADPTQENLDARNAAQTALDEAEQARVAANADLTAANTTLADAQDATVTAQENAAVAQNNLNTSLAANETFVTTITDAGFTADASGIENLDSSLAAANQDVVVAQAQFDALDNTTNTFIRAQEVLVPAAENVNPSIAAASQALLGDPRADETNFEIEVVSALVDHEERITANTDAIAAETAAREEMGTMLMQQITDEQNARIAADNAMNARMDDLEDRVSSSTATAIALGGMGFLPDTRFNLAGNVGFYEGAQAIAVNAGVRVTDRVAVTGGVGGGLNKGGKVGGRVGFIVGF